MAEQQRVTVDIVVFDGVDEMDFVGPLEVIRSAERLGAGISARLVTREPQQLVAGGYGLGFVPDGTYVPGKAGVTIVTGGGWVGRDERGAWGEVQRGDWLPLLAESARRGVVLCGVCTGTLLLAHAGIVGTRRATTHHGALGDLAALGATVVTDRVVDDGDLITCGGVTSGIDLALHLVARECSPAIAVRVAARMEHNQTAPVDSIARGDAARPKRDSRPTSPKRCA
ncbi:MAG: DJ-1/PfpI family protein [Ilumatobacteraceae bacterium]